jgi:hypothetical protein
MSETITNNVEKITAIFQAAEQALSDWAGEGNMQFPILLGMIAVRMNWDEKQVRENDPLVRFHVRNHPDWYVTRGAHGGIMRRSDRDKKEALRLAKDLAKKQMAAALEAKVGASASIMTPDSSDVE